MKRTVSIFGSTGTIGKNALAIVDAFGSRFEVAALAAGRNRESLREQVARYRPLLACLQAGTPSQLAELQSEFPATRFVCGDEGLAECASLKVDVAVMGIVGFAALVPTLELVRHGITVALANKEAVIVAGSLLKSAIAKSGARVIPVDSEHNALYQLLQGREPSEVQTIVLTASGGPLLRMPELPLEDVTPAIAIKHPNWNMGPKISVDSATLMNKGLELIEAHLLFDFPASRIEVWIHPQSIVHGAIWLTDNSCIAQLSKPDMRSPLAFAMGYPERLHSVIPKLTFKDFAKLEFMEPDEARFPALRLARQALAAGPSHLVALNAANEIAVARFLDGQILFPGIPAMIEEVLARHRATPLNDLEAIHAVDAETRALASEISPTFR